MKTSAILCSMLAATMGFSSLASAQDTRQERREARREARQDARQQARQEARRELRRDGVEAARMPHWVNTPSAALGDPAPYYGQRRFYDNPAGTYNHYAAPRYYQNAPRYYANTAPRFFRGGYVPYDYLQPRYYVRNWNAYPGLYAPPYGYQWVQVGDDFLLIALATGLIANMLTM